VKNTGMLNASLKCENSQNCKSLSSPSSNNQTFKTHFNIFSPYDGFNVKADSAAKEQFW